jgi:hypothetical protein
MILGCDGAGVLGDGTEVLIYPVISARGRMGTRTSTADGRG